MVASVTVVEMVAVAVSVSVVVPGSLMIVDVSVVVALT